jgi:hypothetical protein
MMKIHLRTVKASILAITLISILLIACMPNPVAAKGIFQGNIALSYDSTAIPDTVRPETGIVRIPIDITYFVSGFGSRVVIPFYEINTMPIELSVENIPDYMDAAVSPGVVYPYLTIEKPTSPEIAYLTASFRPDAPAFQTVTISVVATQRDRAPVQGITNKIPIQLKSGFYSNYQYDYTPLQEVGAAETIRFPIKITGYANARSQLNFEVVNPPEKWGASINSQYFLGTTALGESSEGTVDFVIQAPLDFGYYNELQTFNVRISTMAAGHPEAGMDNVTVLQFTVRARGFSTPGFEAAFVIISLIAAITIYRKKYNI